MKPEVIEAVKALMQETARVLSDMPSPNVRKYEFEREWVGTLSREYFTIELADGQLLSVSLHLRNKKESA